MLGAGVRENKAATTRIEGRNMANDRPAHVAVESLTKTFGNGERSLTALAGVNLEIGWGEFVSIIGPSGCGKTTLLRLIGGLLQPTAGSAQVAGREPRAAQRGKEIGYVFQDASLLPWRSVLDNVRLPLEVNRRNGGSRRNNRPQQLLELVRLEEFGRYYPRELSGGMQQRVALARALVFEPSLLLMDEPFGALDEITRESMRYELLRIWQASLGEEQATRKTVVFVTHSIPEAILLSDRVIVLSSAPGTVRAVVDIALPRPRSEGVETSRVFLDYTAQLRSLLKEPSPV
jgi:NitT/TauT family transport system ATP-binding protein